MIAHNWHTLSSICSVVTDRTRKLFRKLHCHGCVYLCVKTHYTGRSFEPIFMKFTWLVQIHPWVNPIVFGNNQPNRTTDMGKNVAPKPVLRF